MPSAPSDNPMPPNPVPLASARTPPGSAALATLVAPGIVADPASTTSTTGAMMGLASGAGGASMILTPQVTGRILVILAMRLANNTASDGVSARMRFGTGTPPANGAAPAGTVIGAGPALVNNANTAALAVPINLVGVMTGLTPGVAYWLDVILAAVTGGTASLVGIQAQFLEF